MIRSLPLALALAAVAAPSAAAQAPIDLGPGEDPTIVVDAGGTAHVAFHEPGGDVYCRIPRGAAACDVRTQLPLAGGDGRPWIIDRPDGTLVIVRSTSQSD